MFSNYKKSFFIIVFFGLFVDQLSKALALNSLKDSRKFFFDTRLGFELAYNSGSAFSLFTGSTFILTILAIAIAIALFLYYPKCDSRLMEIAFTFIITGALGNIIDRFFRTPYWGKGRVIDFLVLWDWPTFNIADSFVSVGVALAVIATVLAGRNSKVA